MSGVAIASSNETERRSLRAFANLFKLLCLAVTNNHGSTEVVIGEIEFLRAQKVSQVSCVTSSAKSDSRTMEKA